MLSKDKTVHGIKQTGKVMKIKAEMPRDKHAVIKAKRAAPKKTAADKRAGLKERRVTEGRNKTLARVTVIFFAFVFIFILQGIISFAVKPHIAIDRITLGSVTSPTELTGVIIRDEKVYKSTAAGSIRFDVAENARVKKDELVCDVENTDEVNRINAQLAGVNEELLKVQALRTDNNDVNVNEQRINLLMKNMLDDWPGRMNSSDFSLMYSLKDSLSTNVDLRNQIILSDSPDALTDQEAQRQSYQDELNSNMTLFKSDETGVVSTLIDGYEDTYTLSVTAMLQKEQTVQKGGAPKLLTAQTAEEGTPLFKIIHSNTWYIAAYLPNDLVKDWKADDPKVLYIGGASSGLPAAVDHITEKGGESYVLFKCTRFMEDYLTSRYIHFKAGNDASEGYKIPISSVATKTLLCIPREYVSIDDDQLKTANVTGANGGIINFNYMAIDDNTVYVDPSSGNITSGLEIQSPADAQATFKLSETADITGVYRVNNGAADFRKVVLDTATQNEGYYVLNPDSNKNLQENDSIVHDASKVNEGDIIY